MTGTLITHDTIDRISPTIRPGRPVVGRQRWRRLLFAHWSVDPQDLRKVVPEPLTIDTFEGRAYVGIVPFQMRAIRGARTPAVLGLNFLETNLRTYVHIHGRDPGVYFLSLDASSRIAVLAARRQAGLPYYSARMALTDSGQVSTAELVRMTSPSAHLRLRYSVGDWLGPSRPGTLEHFLLERYLLHVIRDSELYSMQVHHQPYPARRATVLDVDESMFRAAGLPPASGLPSLAHYAEGVDVEIFGPWRAAAGPTRARPDGAT